MKPALRSSLTQLALEWPPVRHWTALPAPVCLSLASARELPAE